MKVTITDVDGGSAVELRAAYECDYQRRSRTLIETVPVTGSRDAALAVAIERMFGRLLREPADETALASELHGDLATPTNTQETTP